MARPAIHHSRLERQLARDLRAIEAAQASGDVGQQAPPRSNSRRRARSGPRPAPATPARSPAPRSAARGDAAGAQRPQHRQALLERKADRRIDDEQADEERQQAEGRQIEMKAVGEAFEVALGVGLRPDAAGRRRRFRAARAGPWPCRSAGAKSGPGLFRSCCAMPISTTSTPGTSCGCTLQRRQRCAVARSRRRAFRRDARSASVSGATSVCPGRRDEGLQAGSSDRRRIADFGRQRDRLDAEQPERSSADLNAAFEHRRYRPAGAAQSRQRAACGKVAPLRADQHRRFARRRTSPPRGRS